MSKHTIHVTINGMQYEDTVDSRTLLVHWIRDGLRLTGTHIGCDTSLLAEPVLYLLMARQPNHVPCLLSKPMDAKLRPSRDLEQNDILHPIQEGFHEKHALQCGYCTSGMMMASVALLNRNPNPSEHEIRVGISGNLCRCTGYVNISQSCAICC